MDPIQDVYATIDPAKLASLETEHAWLIEPLYRASNAVREMPFYDWVAQLSSPLDFKPAAVQLYYHSATFPKVMGLMLALTPMSENAMMPFYARHAFGEADHHMLLMDWMLKHGVLDVQSQIETYLPSTETHACVNYAYQMALEQDRDKWLVGLNSGIERCSNHFFKALAPKMRELAAGHEYFDIHVEADEHHSVMGLAHMRPQAPDSPRGRCLIRQALEGVELWAAMLHSWIGIDLHPHFNLDGSPTPACRPH